MRDEEREPKNKTTKKLSLTKVSIHFLRLLLVRLWNGIQKMYDNDLSDPEIFMQEVPEN